MYNSITPLFSVLIANYNNANYLRDALESVKSQTYPNWEIIIVDDASTDNSLPIINEYVSGDERIKLFENKTNCGVGYTKSRCIDSALGEIAGFLDPDDVLIDNALETMVDLHLENKEAALIYSNCFICDENLNILRRSFVNSIPPNRSMLEYVGEDNMSLSHFTTFKISFYLKSARLDISCKRAIDLDFYYKMEEVGKLIHIDAHLYKYRMHENGLSLGANSIKANSWHMYVIIMTCKRRGLQFEDYIPKLIQHDIIDQERKRRDYVIGNKILRPIRKIKGYISKFK